MALKSGFLARHFGPSFLGVRNWLLISVFFLVAIALLSGFALVPLSGLVFGAIIGLKIGAFIGFVAGVGVGVKGLIDDYVQKSTKNKNETDRKPIVAKSEPMKRSGKMPESQRLASNAKLATTPKMSGGEDLKTQYYWFPYLRDMLFDDFLPWLKSPANAVKFVFGLLLLLGVVSVLLCVCCPAIALAIPGVTVVVGFVSAAFEACSLFAGSWVFTAAFLGVVTMLAYDILLRVGDVFSECCGEEDVKKVQNSASDTEQAKDDVELETSEADVNLQEKTINKVAVKDEDIASLQF